MNTKKAFTLIELIFVIVIIGLLASYAVPKFMQTKASASSASVKSVISSLRTSIETKHGEWTLNDNLDTNNGYTPQGYPQKLDNATANTSNEKLFIGTSTLSLLKTPIISCKQNDCWFKYKDDDTDKNVSYYEYKFNDESYIRIDYDGSNGKIECNDDGTIKAKECESIIN